MSASAKPALTCEIMEMPTPEELAALLPHPAADANKYSRGRCILFVGTEPYGGAAVLATRAARRMGAGYTRVYTAACNADLVRAAAPDAVVGAWNGAVLSRLPDWQEGKPVAYVTGCGFDADNADVRQIVLAVLRAQAPVCVDGGGLSVLSTRQGLALLEVRAAEGFVTVITPHAGEAARLAAALGISTDGTAAPDLAAALAAALGVTVCLKGPDTYIAEASPSASAAKPRVTAMTEGTAALAKAGTGDVLAGMVGALLAQGLAGADAALLASLLHAWAGAFAADDLTDICVTPEDIIEYIPRAVRQLERAR